MRNSVPAGSIGPASAITVEEYTAPGRRTNADALPRLGAGYFSGVTPSAGLKNETLSGQVSPRGPGLTAYSLKLPSRLNLQNCPNRAG